VWQAQRERERPALDEQPQERLNERPPERPPRRDIVRPVALAMDSHDARIRMLWLGTLAWAIVNVAACIVLARIDALNDDSAGALGWAAAIAGGLFAFFVKRRSRVASWLLVILQFPILVAALAMKERAFVAANVGFLLVFIVGAHAIHTRAARA
jgi:hypothetical protein